MSFCIDVIGMFGSESAYGLVVNKEVRVFEMTLCGIHIKTTLPLG